MSYRSRSKSEAIENPTKQQLLEWINLLDGAERAFFHIEFRIGTISVLGGGGNSGRLQLMFQLPDYRTGVIYDESGENNPETITITEDWEVSEPNQFGFTLTRERVSEILVYLLIYNRFPQGIKWSGGNLTVYQ